jgi:hypothetical protein
VLRLRLLLALEVLGNRNRRCGRGGIRVEAGLLLCVAAPLTEAVSGSIHNAVGGQKAKPDQTRPGRGRDWGAGGEAARARLLFQAKMRHGLLEGRVE